MQAIANTTTSTAERSGKPARSSANGSSTSASAAAARGTCSSRIRLLEFLNALAEKSTRAHQQYHGHQEIHRGLAPRGVEIDRDAAHDADQRGGGDDAPERAQAADHDNDEGGREDGIGTIEAAEQ